MVEDNTYSYRTDKYGGVYTHDKKRLLKCPNIKRYSLQASRPCLIGQEYYVHDGVLTICDEAFLFCNFVMVSLPRGIKVIGDAFGKEGGRFEIRD